MRTHMRDFIDLGFAMAGDIHFCAAPRAGMHRNFLFTDAATLGGGFYAGLNNCLALGAGCDDEITLLDRRDLGGSCELNEFFAATFGSVSAKRRRESQKQRGCSRKCFNQGFHTDTLCDKCA